MAEGHYVDAGTDVTTKERRVEVGRRAVGSTGSGRIVLRFRASFADAHADSAEEEFLRYERKWKQETQYVSSLSDKYLHSSYADIIGMGPRAVGPILRSLRRQPNDWFYALRAITKADPVLP